MPLLYSPAIYVCISLSERLSAKEKKTMKKVKKKAILNFYIMFFFIQVKGAFIHSRCLYNNINIIASSIILFNFHRYLSSLPRILLFRSSIHPERNLVIFSIAGKNSCLIACKHALIKIRLCINRVHIISSAALPRLFFLLLLRREQSLIVSLSLEVSSPVKLSPGKYMHLSYVSLQLVILCGY